MSDVINSIFGRAQNETPSSGGYAYGTTETVEATAPAAETTEAEDTTVGETADVDATEEDATEPEHDEAAAEEDGDEAIADEDEAVAEDATDESDEDEAVTEDDDEAAAEESDEDEALTEDEDEAVAEDATEESDEDSDEAVAEEAAEEPVVAEAVEEPVAAAEPEPARSAAGSRGSTTVADGVVTKIVVRVARQAEGVYELDEAGTSVEVEGEVATIAVTLVVEFGRAVKTLAEQIRVEVIEAVEEYLGLEVSSVDVHVADIHFPDAD